MVAAILASKLFSLNPEFSERHFQPSNHDVATQDQKYVFGFLVAASASSEAGTALVHAAVDTIARLLAYDPTVMPCFRANGSEKVGDYREKLNNDTFSLFLPKALAPQVHKVGAFLNRCCAQKATVSSLWIDSNEGSSTNTFHRRATVEMLIHLLRQWIIAISCS